MPETIRSAFKKASNSGVRWRIVEKAILKVSSYCSDSEESQMVQMVAGPGRWRDGEEGQTQEIL